MLKQALIAVGYPAEDLAGYTEGADAADLALREVATTGCRSRCAIISAKRPKFSTPAATSAAAPASSCCPCGAGKTIVGIVAMALLQKNTLVLTTSITAVKQWRREIIDKTTLTEDEVKEYTGETKEIGPVTVATYQILTYRPDKTEDFPHFGLFDERDWGLIIYDEVHLLPAPVFRVTATIQARRRLGLTATLIREDGREGDVFSLIGPKKYDVPWRELETQGLDRIGELHRDSRGLAGRQDAHGVRGRRPPREVPHRQRERSEGRGRRGIARAATTTSACSSSAST